MTRQLSLLVRRTLALAAVLASLFAAGLASEAQALTPERTSVTQTVNIVYWDLVRFWIPSTNPGVRYYNYYSNRVLIDYQTPCGPTGESHGGEGFYCSDGSTIHLDYNQQVGNMRSYRDGSVAFWLAHEFAHHIESLLGINWTTSKPYHELLADCFAGMYFRHGIYTSKRLNSNDYLEARNQIWALGAGDTDHGTNSQRLRAFDFGFQQVNRNNCIQGAGTSY